MDTWVRTATVAIASLVAGFLLSKLLGDDVVDAEAYVYSDLVTEIASAPAVETVAAAVVLEPLPVPVILPNVSFQFAPVPVVEPLPQNQDALALEVPDDESPLDESLELADGPLELEYVATLHEADADVEDGFVHDSHYLHLLKKSDD